MRLQQRSVWKPLNGADFVSATAWHAKFRIQWTSKRKLLMKFNLNTQQKPEQHKAPSIFLGKWIPCGDSFRAGRDLSPEPMDYDFT